METGVHHPAEGRSNTMDTADFAVMKNDIGHMGGLLRELKTEIAGISQSLRALIGIEAKQLQLVQDQAKIAASIDGLEDQYAKLDKRVPDKVADRLQAIENEIPGLKQMKYWVIAAIGALVAGSFWGLITGHLMVVSK